MGRRDSRWRSLSDDVGAEGRRLWTRSADPGVAVHQESLRRMRGGEWRAWDPRSSKLAAGMLRTRQDQRRLLPEPGSTVAYLGAGHGSTISHLHDHLCGPDNTYGGRLVSVDIAARCLRDLTALARRRRGIVPVLGDARKPQVWMPLVGGRVDWLFQDVALAGQAEAFITAARAGLAPGGVGLLSLKSHSERRRAESDGDIIRAAADACAAAGLEVEEVVALVGWEEGHALIVLRAPHDWPHAAAAKPLTSAAFERELAEAAAEAAAAGDGVIEASEEA